MKIKKYIDFKLLKYLSLFYTLVVVLDFTKKCYWKIKGLNEYDQMSWYNLISYNVFLDWVVVLVFMIFISHLTKILFENGELISWKNILVAHLFLSFFIGYFIFFVVGGLLYLINVYSYTKFLQNLSLDHFMYVVELNFLVYFSMLGIINVYYYIKKVKNIEIQKTKIESNLNKTRLIMLKSQLHPHFVFNTLNSISSLMEIDKQRSQNLIADFGDLFRNILTVRFSDHLTIIKKVDSELTDYLLPNLILQPILENSVKHGYSYNKTQLNIELSIYRKTNYLYLIIVNDGDPLTKSFHELMKNGMGLRNTRERLKLLYNKDFEFKIYNKKNNNGVEAFIKIPIVERKT